jgi:hypothetical protein
MPTALAHCAECGWGGAAVTGKEGVPIAPGTVPAPTVKAESPGTAPPAPSAGLATLHITSDPAGADIELDGQYVGSTPSEIKLKPGQHAIKVTKKGFAAWHRYLAIEAADSRTIVAELEKVSQ